MLCVRSFKPLWNSKLSDCGLVLGTNALEPLGFQIMNPSGRQVGPVGKRCTPGGPQVMESDPKLDAAVHAVLDQKLQLGSFQSKVVKTNAINTNSDKCY